MYTGRSGRGPALEDSSILKNAKIKIIIMRKQDMYVARMCVCEGEPTSTLKNIVSEYTSNQ